MCVYRMAKGKLCQIPGGGGEIRTPERLATLRAFQARALGHYATPPYK